MEGGAFSLNFSVKEHGLDMLNALDMVHRSKRYLRRKTEEKEKARVLSYDSYCEICTEYGLQPAEPKETYPYDHFRSLYLFSNVFEAYSSLLDDAIPPSRLEEFFEEHHIYRMLYQKLDKLKKENPYEVARKISNTLKRKIPLESQIPEDAKIPKDDFIK